MENVPENSSSMEETNRDSSEEQQITCQIKNSIKLGILMISTCILVAIIITIAITYKRTGNKDRQVALLSNQR